MTNKVLATLADEVLGNIERAGTLRQLHELSGVVGPRMQLDGREVVLFSSSNYLDLAHHPEVVEASVRASREIGCAATGSRLITGNMACHQALEQELAAFLGCAAALTFGTGYMVNLGVIPALVGQGDVVVSDALVHASIVDGARLSRAEVVVFPHADLTALASTLQTVRARARRVLLVVDGVYSMHGDVAPLREISSLARQHDAMLLLDDAHGIGTLGTLGRGVVEAVGMEYVDVLVGTLGKAFGSFGAFVAGSSRLRDLLINTARSFIFSCALAPPQIEAARAALRVIGHEPWRRQRLQDNAARLRRRLAAAGISTAPSTTHIVPIVIGDNAKTMQARAALLERGFHAQGIRYPSVPKGGERLRATPMATHTADEVDAFADAVIAVLRA